METPAEILADHLVEVPVDHLAVVLVVVQEDLQAENAKEEP